MTEIKETPFSFYLSGAFRRLWAWSDTIQQVQETGRPIIVTDARYVHFNNPPGVIQGEVDWTERLRGETAPQEGWPVLRGFFTAASAEETRIITAEPQIPEEFLDRAIVARIDCLGGKRFSGTPLFNAVTGFESDYGFAVAYSGKFQEDKSKGLARGMRVCRVTNRLPDGVRIIGRYNGGLDESFVVQGM